MLADSGGTCKCPGLQEDPTCLHDREYSICLNGRLGCEEPGFGTKNSDFGLSDGVVLKRDLITATAAIAGFSSILFGLLTNLPVALG